jgi:hypothetical protein
MRDKKQRKVFGHPELAFLFSLVLPLPNTAVDSGQIRLGAAANYLDTTKNFDNDGNKVSLPSNTGLQSATGALFFEYGATQELTFLANLQGTYNLLTATPQNASAIQSVHTSIRDAGVDLRYQPSDLPVRMIFDATAELPLYSRASPDTWGTLSSATAPPIGEGITSLGVQITAEVPLSPGLYASVQTGYTTRSSGFSNFLTYGGHVKYELPRSLFARVGLIGQSTASEDQFANTTPIVKDRSTAAIGGSNAFNTINPSFLKAEGTLNISFTPSFFAAAGIQFPISGKNVVQDPVYVAAFGFEFGGKTKESDYTHSNRGFQQYYLASKVVKANNELKQVLIDKGKGEGIRTGEFLDLFEPDSPDGNFGPTVARARVIEAGQTRSKLQILEYYKDEPIEEGFVVRRPVR